VEGANFNHWTALAKRPTDGIGKRAVKIVVKPAENETLMDGN
jgi:hypothetical protein